MEKNGWPISKPLPVITWFDLTWLAKRWQGTNAKPEGRCKLSEGAQEYVSHVLQHANEIADPICNNIQVLMNWLNQNICECCEWKSESLGFSEKPGDSPPWPDTNIKPLCNPEGRENRLWFSHDRTWTTDRRLPNRPTDVAVMSELGLRV